MLEIQFLCIPHGIDCINSEEFVLANAPCQNFILAGRGIEPATTEVGGAFNVTEMGPLGAAMLIVAEADFVESVTEVAVTVTVAGLGTEPGAVNLVAAPLAVEVAERLPHCPLPQVTDHLTPPFSLSLLTTAVRLAAEPASTDVGA
jgi:hypothetical protein